MEDEDVDRDEKEEGGRGRGGEDQRRRRLPRQGANIDKCNRQALRSSRGASKTSVVQTETLLVNTRHKPRSQLMILDKDRRCPSPQKIHWRTRTRQRSLFQR